MGFVRITKGSIRCPRVWESTVEATIIPWRRPSLVDRPSLEFDLNVTGRVRISFCKSVDVRWIELGPDALVIPMPDRGEVAVVQVDAVSA